MTDSLVGPEGFAEPRIGHRALDDVDIADAAIRSGPFRLPPRLARARLKEWQHYCLISPEVLVTTAVVDARVMRVSWVQVVDLETGERWEHHRQSPLADIALARSLWDERSHYRAPGYDVGYHSHLAAGRHVLAIRAEADGETPAVEADWTIEHADDVDSLVVSLPVGRRRCAYSHKVPLPVVGDLTIGGRHYAFDPADSVAILDIHKAHYPRHMFWRWATFAGRDAHGQLVGMNLTKNVVEDDVTWNENAVWLDGRAHRFGPAVFDYDPDDLERPWQLGSADGAVQLRFVPKGSRGESLDIPGIARSRFTQLYGRFEGTVRAGSELVEVDGLVGLCEEHDSIW